MDYQSVLRAVILAVCVAGLPGLAQAMEHFVRPLQDQNGRAIAGATVSVYIAGSTTLATIYSDNGATVKSNPITTGVDGMMDFYAPNGLYDLSPVAKGYVFNINQYKRLTVIDPGEIGGGPPGSCIRTVSGTSDRILSSDSGCIVVYTDTGIVLVTLPQAGSAGFGTSFNVTLLNLNATTLLITPENSSIQGVSDLTLLAGQSTDIRSDGANYFHSPGMKNPTGWPQDDTIKEITWAASESSAQAVGDGTRKMLNWCEATNGCIQKPDPPADTIWRIWPGMMGEIYDEQQQIPLALIVPNSLGTGSGTIVIQSGQQVVASNLGVEFAESDTNPNCSAGKFNIYADLSENKLKKCQNGTVSDISASATATEGTVRKTSDQTVNNSTTVVSDSALLVALDTNSTYEIKLFILYDSSTTADFKYDFTLPAGATGRKATNHAPTSTTTCSGTSGVFIYNDITLTNNNVGGAGTGTSNTCAMVIDSTIVTAGTAGNIQFRWAQATLDATNTVVRANSWLYWKKIP